MNKQKIRITLSLIAGLVMFIIVFVHNRSQSMKQSFLNSEPAQRELQVLPAAGIISKEDMLHVLTIQDTAIKGKQGSSTDINWLLQMLDQANPTDNASSRRRVLALQTIMYVVPHGMSETDAQRVYDAELPLLTKYTVAETTIVTATLGELKDKRAIPYLMPLLNAPDKNVRTCAGLSLRMLGYTPQK